MFLVWTFNSAFPITVNIHGNTTVEVIHCCSLCRLSGIQVRKAFLLLEQMMDKLEFTTSSTRGTACLLFHFFKKNNVISTATLFMI